MPEFIVELFIFVYIDEIGCDFSGGKYSFIKFHVKIDKYHQ